MIQLSDQYGNTHSFDSSPKRIVSLVPSQTELLYDMGLEEKIVGITKFCIHPFHFKNSKKIIGGTKKVHTEKIRLLNPDIIIANKEENTLEIVDTLSKICPVWVTDIITISDNQKMIEDFGIIFNKRTEARKLIDKINYCLADFQCFIKDKKTKKATYFIWANPYMVAGSDTFINELLKLNKFENIYENNPEYTGRYPEIDIQKMKIHGEPEIILLSSEPFPFNDEHAFEIGRYTHHAKTLFVDGEMFSWYGSRLIKAFQYFKQIHLKI